MEKITNKKDAVPIWQYFFCVILFLSAFIFIKLNVSFTNSGEITFYLVEILGIFLCIFLFFYSFKHYKNLTKNRKILFWTAVVSQAAFLLIYIARIFIAGLEMKSILILESNLLVFGLYLLMLFNIISAGCVITSLSYFSAVLGVLSVLLILFSPKSYTDWPLFSNSDFYILTFGNAIRTFILVICLPLSAFHYYLSPRVRNAVCFYLHLATTVICGMISGARVNYLCIPLAILLLFILFLRFIPKRRWLMSLLIPGVSALSIVLVFILSIFSMRIYTQLVRLDITKQALELFHIEYIQGAEPSPDDVPEFPGETDPDLEDMIHQAENSALESSNSRAHMWKLAFRDILKAPFFGNGLKQYEFTFSNGQTLPMQAHNFVLEYLLGFGLVGFLLWAVMMIAPEWMLLKKARFKFWNAPALCFALCSLAFACAGGLFQPYFLYPCIMFFVFTLIGCYFMKGDQSE